VSAARDDRRTRRGFTYLELMIGVLVSSVIVTVGTLAWKPISESTLSLRNRARDVSEMRLAVEALLADLGGAETALPGPDENELLIVREQAVAELQGAWSGGGDEGILYSLSGGDLVRQDLALGSSIVIAQHLGEFGVERVDGIETHVTLRAGAGLDERSVELVWPQ
jgi:hypothetical protein